MSQNVTFNGQVYVIPDLADNNWGQNVTDYLVALPQGALQKTGGSFTLAADIDFGASYGLKSTYFKTRASNPASAGLVRLANTDTVVWRNAGNSGDLALAVNGSNQLTFNGVILESDVLPSAYIFVGNASNESTGVPMTGDIGIDNTGLTAIQGGVIINTDINASAAIALSKLAALTINKSLVSDGSGVIATGWDYSSGNMQTTINGALRFTDGTTNYVGFASPAAVTTHTYLLPIAAGLNGQVLSWTTGGQLAWINASGTGTINSGTQYQLTYYAANGTTVSGLTLITGNRALASDANGLPVASSVTDTELGYVSGVTSAIQTQLGNKLNLAGGTMVGNIAMSGTQKLTGLAAGSVAGDSVRYEQVLLLAGGTMAGNIAMGTNKLTGLGAGSVAGDSVRYEQVLLLTGGTMVGDIAFGGSYKLTGLAAGSTNGDSVRYEQVVFNTGDQAVSGIKDFTGQLKGKGTATNDSAASGYIGEYVQSVITSNTNYPATGIYGDLTSISLTAGDWDVTAIIQTNQGGATITALEAGISTTSGNSGTGLVNGSNNVLSYGINISVHSISIPNYRMSLSSTTTVYLKYIAAYTVGTPTAIGRLSARRIR